MRRSHSRCFVRSVSILSLVGLASFLFHSVNTLKLVGSASFFVRSVNTLKLVSSGSFFVRSVNNPKLVSSGQVSCRSLVREVRAAKKPSEWIDNDLQLLRKSSFSTSYTKFTPATRNRAIERDT